MGSLRLENGATFQLSFRVEYHETDGQRRVHHANYVNYFERARVEMLRAAGLSYKRLEDIGLMLVVSEMNIKYHSAAEFDDLLTLSTQITAFRKVRLCHRYRIDRAGQLVVEGSSTIACVDQEGQLRRIPIDW